MVQLGMTFTLPAIPSELRFLGEPALPPRDWGASAEGTLSITAPAKTDWFLDPGGDTRVLNAPAALFAPVDEAFTLQARVRVDFGATFDAGVLTLRVRDDLWAKLCFEYSPQRQPTVVSVVTRGRSDDCNSTPIDGNEIYLRLAARGATVAMHSSTTGKRWNLVRYFSLGEVQSPGVGFLAQSPTGEGCTVAFSEIAYRPGFPENLRDGS